MQRISRRYRIAFVAAIFLIAAGWLFVRHYSSNAVIKREYERLGEASFVMSLEQYTAWRKSFSWVKESEQVEISEFLSEHWRLSVLVAFAICFGIAFLVDRFSRIREAS